MSQNLELTQTQRLRLTRQQLQFVRLLELNAPEMDEAVERELEENPALEPEYAAEPEKTTAAESRDTTPWYLRSANNGTPDTDYDIIGADTDVSLFDYLERQLDERTLSLRIRAGAVYIIGNLDSNGYLRRPLTNILDDLAFGEGLDLTDEGVKRPWRPCARSTRPASAQSRSANASFCNFNASPHPKSATTP